MAEPLYIPKTEADQNTQYFQDQRAAAIAAGVDLVHVTPDMAQLKPEDKGNVQAYAHAKAMAKVLGTTTDVIAAAAPDAPEPFESDLTHIDMPDGTRWINGKTNPTDYQRLKAQAQASHMKFRTARTWDHETTPDDVREAVRAS